MHKLCLLMVVAALLCGGCFETDGAPAPVAASSESEQHEEQRFIEQMGSEPGISVVQRIPNGDSTLEAVLVNRETNATVATPTEVYVLKKGAKVEGEPVFRADHVEGVKLAWENADQLEVSALQARVFLEKEDVGSGKKLRISFDIGERL